MTPPYFPKNSRPQVVSALWAARALQIFSNQALLESCLPALEAVSGIFDESDSSDVSMDDRLANILEKLEKFEAASVPGQIRLNVQKLAQIIRLDFFESRLLEMAAVLIEDDWLQRFCLGINLQTRWQAIRLLSVMLKCGISEVAMALGDNCVLHISGLLQYSPKTNDINQLLAVRQDKGLLLCQQEFQPFDLLDGMVQIAMAPKFHNLDFSHIRPTVEILKAYIGHQIKNNVRGANILIYGKAGTGKSELLRSLMRTFNRRLLEVPYVTDQLEVLPPRKRLESYLKAQACIAPRQTILEFDHFEGIFQPQPVYEHQQSRIPMLQTAWLFRMLEQNPIPTIWITNDTSLIPDDFLNRMDGVFEVHAPNSKWRTSLLYRMRRARQMDLSVPEIVSEMEGLMLGAMDHLLKTAELVHTPEEVEARERTVRFLAANFQKIWLSRSTDTEKPETIPNPQIKTEGIQ